MRALAVPFVVAPPSGARVRTRLRVSPADEGVLRAVGDMLGALAGRDLAWRCALGRGGSARAERKRAVTARSSSRWAGAITRTSNDQWQRAYRNLLDLRTGLRRAIATIEARLAAPVGSRAGRVRGYATGAERWAKQQRLGHLGRRLADVEGRLAAGRVSIVRGGRRLAHARHHLEAAGLTETEWRSRWTAERSFICADGEADKNWGNETIRVHPEAGWCELKLPAALAHLANRPHGRYRLSCPVGFRHRNDEWAAQAASGAVRYDISFDPDRGRWYLDASWRIDPGPAAGLDELRGHRTLAVDLNADHLAAWVVVPDGNPVGAPHTILLDLDGVPAATRDGRLRHAITTLLDIAQRYGCASVTIEDLGFADARHTGRETMGRGRRGRRFRRTVAALPTGRFRTRLVGMAHNRGVAVIAVDPAYTSRWGAQHWQRPLDSQTSPTITVTRHHAAAVVIGRRGHGHRGRRRPGVPDPHQRMGQGELPARPATHPPTARNPDTPQAARQTTRRRRKTCPADRAPPGEPGDPTPFGAAGEPGLTPAHSLGTVRGIARRRDRVPAGLVGGDHRRLGLGPGGGARRFLRRRRRGTSGGRRRVVVIVTAAAQHDDGDQRDPDHTGNGEAVAGCHVGGWLPTPERDVTRRSLRWLPVVRRPTHRRCVGLPRP